MTQSSTMSSSKSTNSEGQISIAGDYVANTGDKARLDGSDKQWKIDYQTPDGGVSAEFTTEWQTEGDTLTATDKMKKSDGNSDFTITIRIFKYKTAKSPLITITMSDGNPAHEMVFANQNDFFAPSEQEKTKTSDFEYKDKCWDENFYTNKARFLPEIIRDVPTNPYSESQLRKTKTRGRT